MPPKLEKKGEQEEGGLPKDYQKNPPHMDGIGDMSKLIYLEEPNVLHNLVCRYASAQIYTYMSDILIAINPYERLNIYEASNMERYRAKRRAELRELPPHCYAVAEESYQLMVRTGKNQSMVICGESGSGKTETAKVFMRYMAHVTSGGAEEAKVGADGRLGSASVEEQFIQANPVLEAFGNARTVMNNNSSRFGKFTKVLFEAISEGQKGFRPKILGSAIETYLLEKSRVVHQEKGERNYHIFYQLCKGMPYEMVDELRLRDWKMFHYLNSSPDASGDDAAVFDIPGVSDAQNFEITSEAMLALGVQPDKQAEVFQCVAAVLHLGNIDFDSLDGESVTVSEESKQNLNTAAILFQVPLDGMEKRLTTRKLKVGTQVIIKPLKEDEAVYNRDAVSKALYSGLFNWIVRNINTSLAVTTGATDLPWIGILDVFGFESSDWNNSFEQLCINFANERLQQYFNASVIIAEQEEYLREAIPWTELEVPNNQDTIDLIAGKPHGIIATLDSTCVMPKGTDDIFVDNLFNAHKKHRRITRARTRKLHSKTAKARALLEKQKRRGQRERFSGFIIHHYAGDVCYNSEGFLDKNADATHDDTVLLFSGSTSSVAKELLSPPSDGGTAKKAPKRRRAFASVGGNFAKQLDSLMKTLQATTPHFVRCVNPNQFKQARQFDVEYVRPQLRCGGLLEALRVLKLGYPSRVPYQEIYDRYGQTLEKQRGKKLNPMDFCEAVFLAFGCDPLAYQLGLSKVFFRPGKQEWLETVLGENPELSPEMAQRISSLMIRKRIKRVRGAMLLCAKLQLWVKKQRAFHNLAKAAGAWTVVGKVLEKSLAKLRKNRAAQAIQAALLTVGAQKRLQDQANAAKALGAYASHMYRRMELRVVLEGRVTAAKDKKNGAADKIQRALLSQFRAASLKADLVKRVEATRVRKETEAKMAEEARQKAEEERKRKEAEELERLRQEEEERKKREEEERQQREAEEKAAAEAAEAARQAALSERQRQREEEEKAAREAEEKERQDREAQAKALEDERKEQLEAEEAARKAAEEELKQKEDAAARERKWEDAIAEEKRRKEEERLAKEAAEAEEAERKADEEAERLYQQREKERKRIEEELRKLEELEKLAMAGAPGQAPDKLPPAPTPPPAAPPAGARGSTSENRPRGASKARPPPPSYPIPKHILEKHRKRKAELERQRKAMMVAQMSPEEIAAQHRQVLLNGAKFLKYGKRGAPHIKHVCMTATGNLHWDSNPMDPREKKPSSSYIKLKNVIGVYGGKTTEVLKRRVSDKAPEYLCFSIVTKERTLDLQAVTVAERDQWIRAIDSAVNDVRRGMNDMIKGTFRQRPQATAGGRVRSATVAPNSAGRQQASGGANFSAQRGRGVSLAPPPDYLDDVDFLEAGEKLLKHGRMGKPKPRWINCSKDKLFWGEHNIAATTSAGYSSFILLADVRSVEVGKQTDVFARKVALKVPEELCFSLVLKNRTLDLQCESQERRDEWVAAVKGAINRAKQAAHSQWLTRQRSESKLKRTDVAGSFQSPEALPAVRMRSATVGHAATDQQIDFRAQQRLQLQQQQEDTEYSTTELPTAPPSPSATDVEDGTVGAEDDAVLNVDSTTGMPVLRVDFPSGYRRKNRRGSVEIMAANMRRNMERQANLQAVNRAAAAAAQAHAAAEAEEADM